MLLVSSFNPAVRNSGSRNIKTSNSGRTFFQSKPNMVSFKSTQAELTNSAEKEIAKITQEFLSNHPDILGKNFKNNVLKPWEDFLKSYGVSIKHESSRWETRTHTKLLNWGSVKNGYKSYLVDGEDRIIHGGTYIPGGATKNHSAINLINALLDKKLDMNDNSCKNFPNPLQGVSVPENLKDITIKVKKALADFQWKWVRIPNDGDDLKAERLQRAFLNLMPED